MSRLERDNSARTSTRFIGFDGHTLAYRVSGTGPALVVLNGYRGADMVQARVLNDSWRVFQIYPLGQGHSARVPGYSGEDLSEQIHAVLDRHDVDRFVIWGYSQRGAMAVYAALGSRRAAAWICGGYSVLGFLSAAVMRQMDRRLPTDHPSRSVWAWVRSVDWEYELLAMSCPGLLYWGSDDRQMAKGLRQMRDGLFDFAGIDFIEFPGLAHGDFDDDVMTSTVIPAVKSWAGKRLSPTW